MRENKMSRSLLIARCVLMALGLYALNSVLGGIYLPFAGLCGPSVAGAVAGLSALAVTFGIAWYLLFRGEYVIRFLAGAAENNAPAVKLTDCAKAFRVVIVLCGIFFLSNKIDLIGKGAVFLIYGFNVLLDAVAFGYVDEMYKKRAVEWAVIAGNLACILFGVYLVFGAPQYVRWRLKKLRKTWPVKNPKV